MIALGTDSGPILAPFWLPKSDQIGPKRAPKSIKKVIEKHVEFGIDFETIFGHFWAREPKLQCKISDFEFLSVSFDFFA